MFEKTGISFFLSFFNTNIIISLFILTILQVQFRFGFKDMKNIISSISINIIIVLFLAGVGLRLWATYKAVTIPTKEDEYGLACSYNLNTYTTNSKTTRILLVADMHFGRNKKLWKNYEPYIIFLHWYKNQSEKDPYDAVFNLGDITDESGKSQYKNAYEYLQNMKKLSPSTRMLAIPGNHDKRHHDRYLYAEYFGKMYQALLINGISFYFIDSSSMFVDWAQLKKLKAAVKKDFHTKVFITHIPLTTHYLTSFYMGNGSIKQKHEIIAMMKANNVNLYIAGHRHQEKGPFEFSPVCHEITLASLYGKANFLESIPTWYELDYSSNNPKLFTLYRYLCYSKNHIEKSKVADFSVSQNNESKKNSRQPAKSKIPAVVIKK